MIPIRFRLDVDNKKEYIKKIRGIVTESECKKLSNRIDYLLKLFEHRGYADVTRLRNEAEKYKKDFPDEKFWCMWILMSFDEIDNIRKFLKSFFIDFGINRKTKTIELTGGKIKPLYSYADLQLRRSRIAMYTNSDVQKHIKSQFLYDKIYLLFKQCVEKYSKFSQEDINNWIVDLTEVKVCPYCNLAYTYNRGNKATAQLDHFFAKAEYSMFALCFYNLIPACPACNGIKSMKPDELTSPYQENAFEHMRITWEWENTSISSWKIQKKLGLHSLEKNIKIEIYSDVQSDNNNVDVMKIKEAYSQHKDYASEVIKKISIYTNKNAQKLISVMGKKVGIKNEEIERFYLGNYIADEQLGKRTLSKLTSDFYKEYMDRYHGSIV